MGLWQVGGKMGSVCMWAVAYLGGHWAMAPFGKNIFFGPRKKIGKRSLANPLCKALVARENLPP